MTYKQHQQARKQGRWTSWCGSVVCYSVIFDMLVRFILK